MYIVFTVNQSFSCRHLLNLSDCINDCFGAKANSTYESNLPNDHYARKDEISHHILIQNERLTFALTKTPRVAAVPMTIII